jgi:hypothetical protein
MSSVDFEAAYEVASAGKITYKAIAEALSCSPRRLRVLRQENPDFDKTLLQAREDGYFALADSLLTIYDDHPDEDANKIRGRSDNIKWYLSRLFARVFGDKIDITLTEKVDIRGSLNEALARSVRVINPPELSINPLD